MLRKWPFRCLFHLRECVDTGSLHHHGASQALGTCIYIYIYIYIVRYRYRYIYREREKERKLMRSSKCLQCLFQECHSLFPRNQPALRPAFVSGFFSSSSSFFFFVPPSFLPSFFHFFFHFLHQCRDASVLGASTEAPTQTSTRPSRRDFHRMTKNKKKKKKRAKMRQEGRKEGRKEGKEGGGSASTTCVGRHMSAAATNYRCRETGVRAASAGMKRGVWPRP